MKTTLALTLSLALAPAALAADHRDGPAVRAEPAADINDVFAWTSPDAQKLNLAMTVFPFAGAGARFSNEVQYVFHTTSAPELGAAGADVDVICVFDAQQVIECWVGEDAYLRGDAGDSAGLASSDGRVRVFAGLRNDPFFFNLNGFSATADIVAEAAGSLSFDAAGCPLLDAGTSNLLVTQLSSEPDGSAATDEFLGASTLAIVLSIDKQLVTPGGPIVGVWGSTNAR